MRTLIIVLLALMVAACATGERMAWLEEGMSPEEVQSAMLGSPTGQTRQGNLLQYTYTNGMVSGWGYDRADFYMVFENDRLVAWGADNVRQNRPPINTLMVLDPLAPYRQPQPQAPTVVIQQQPGTYRPSYYP